MAGREDRGGRRRRPAGAEAAAPGPPLPSLARRKLVDKIMTSFVIGNTHGRALWTPAEAAARLRQGRPGAESPGTKRRKRDVAENGLASGAEAGNDAALLEFLYVGVGDLRNPLKTLRELETAASSSPEPRAKPSAEHDHVKGDPKHSSISRPAYKARFVLNDTSSLTLARDAALLVVAVSLQETDAGADAEFASVTALWCDALVTPGERKLLEAALDALLDANSTAAPWLSFDTSTRAALRPHWLAWRRAAARFDPAQSVRNAAIRQFGDGAGHGRAQTSRAWLDSGVSLRSASVVECLSTDLETGAAREDGLVPNPLLYDFTAAAKKVAAQPTTGTENVQPRTLRFVDSQGPTGAFGELAGLKPGGTAFGQVLCGCWAELWGALRQATARGAARFHLVAGDCIELLSQGQLGAEGSFAAIDTSNVADYVGLWNLLLLCAPLLEANELAFVQTESILSAAENLGDLLSTTPPRSSVAARDLAALIGLVPSPPPPPLAPDAEEKIVRTRWSYHAPTEADVTRMVQKGPIKKLAGELQACLPAEVQIDTKMLSRQLLRPELQMLIELAHTNPGPRALSEALSNALAQSRARTKSARVKAAFESTFFLFLHDVFVPQPVTSEMLRDPRQTIAGSYPFPTHTVLTALAMLAAIAKRSAPGRVLARNFLKSYFRDAQLHELPHVRLRSMALRTVFSQSEQNSVSSALAGALTPLACRSVDFVFETITDVWKPKGGLLEPSLALLLLTSESSLGDRMVRDVGRFYIDQADGLEHNQNFEHVAQAAPRHVQIVDNLRLLSSPDDEPGRLSVRVTLPSKHPYTRAYLLDVQMYAILTRPVDIIAAVEGLDGMAP